MPVAATATAASLFTMSRRLTPTFALRFNLSAFTASAETASAWFSAASACFRAAVARSTSAWKRVASSVNKSCPAATSEPSANSTDRNSAVTCVLISTAADARVRPVKSS